MAICEDLFPSWMITLYTCSDYFQSCDDCWRSDGGGLLVKGKIPAKYQKNFFVLNDGALALACSHCKDLFTGKGTIRIQIRRSSHHGRSQTISIVDCLESLDDLSMSFLTVKASQNGSKKACLVCPVFFGT